MAQRRKKKKNRRNSADNILKETASEAVAVDAVYEDDEYAEAERKAARAFAELDEDERAEVIAAPAVEVPRSADFSENDAVMSITSLQREDIPLYEDADGGAKKRKKKKLRLSDNIIMLTVFLLCAAVLVYCVITLTKSMRDKIAGQQMYDNTEFDRFGLGGINDSFNHPMPLTMLEGDASMMTIYQRLISGSESSSTVNSQYSKKLDAMRASLNALKAKNKDIYGWIYIENTVIDHPFVRGENNSYYVDHAYTGEALPIGSVFIDCTAEDHLTDNYNSVLYGHNVVDVAGSKSSMFHDITKFFDEAFFAENRIYIYTMDGVFIFKPVAVYKTTSDSDNFRLTFRDEDDFVSYANAVILESQIPSGESFAKGDKMLSLYTCTSSVNKFRYVLQAKLVETIK